MRFSTRAEYGLKAMANLAKNFPEKKSLLSICQEEKISQKYLERLIQKLRKNNLVKSYKGKSGGYALSKNPKLIKAGEIIEILEETIAPMECSDKKCSLCHCSSSLVWVKLGTQIRKTLYSIKLSDLI